MTIRRIHTLHRLAAGPTVAPPLIFVHGGYATARCWDKYFLPYFNYRGFDCHALDLSGHSDSEGRERLDSFGIDDYVEDLAQVAQGLHVPAIVIGHSMGMVVVERFSRTRRGARSNPHGPGASRGDTLRNDENRAHPTGLFP